MERLKVNFKQEYSYFSQPKKVAKKECSSFQDFRGALKKPNAENLKAIYLNKATKVSFGRKTEEHMSWGANVLPDGKVSFKIWAPYAESVRLEVRDINNPPIEDHNESEIKTIVDKFKDYKLDEIKANKWFYEFGKKENANNLVELRKNNNGVFEIVTDGVQPGNMYRFVLTKNVNGRNIEVSIKDPYSKSQPFDTHGWSQVVDDSYDWGSKEKEWQEKFKQKRLKDPGAPYGNLIPPKNLVLEQVHIGTYTDEGTYEALIAKLEKIAEENKKNGNKKFNGIHILPPAEFYGKLNWGYDGIDLFAPESSYVGDNKKNNAPKLLKDVIKKAHELGLTVIVDVVYNHWGPNYTVVQEMGPYFGPNTPWGAGFNFEGKEGGKQVREFVVDNALHWLKNYHADGLRLDMTKYMNSDVALKEIAFEVRKHKPEAILIAEDSRDYPNLVKPLPPEMFDSKDEGQILNSEDVLNNARKDGQNIDFNILTQSGFLNDLGFDAHWNFGMCHTLESLVTNHEKMGYKPDDAVGNLEKQFRYGYKWANENQGLPPTHTLLNYSMSHDEAGNNGGTRLITKILNARLNMFQKINDGNLNLIRNDINNLLKSHPDWNWSEQAINDQINKRAGQKAEQTTQYLLEAYVAGDNKKWTETLFLNNVPWGTVSKGSFKYELESALSLNKIAQGLIWMYPGPKMFLQGDLEGDASTFKYFRDTPQKGLVEYISSHNDKGYNISYDAFLQSKVGQKGNSLPGIKAFNEELARLFFNNKALNDSDNTNLKVTCHSGSNKLFAVHRFNKNNSQTSQDKEFFAVMNFGENDFYGNYYMHFPEGKWKQILSSDDKRFAGRGIQELNNNEIIGKGLTYNDSDKVPIKLPKQSFMLFEKVK